jgi:hypothetical protein
MMKMILNGQARAPDLISSIPNQIENVIHSMIESGFRVAGKEKEHGDDLLVPRVF